MLNLYTPFSGDYLNTIGDALAHARTYPDITPMEAQVLLGKITDRERTWLIAHPEADLASDHADQYQIMLDRLAAGEPLAYLTGTREFYGLSFMITPDVLVPRPDTEELVDAVLEWARDRSEPLRLVDVGTGSGIIAISLASKLLSAHVTAIDVSAPAVEIARANAERHGVADRMAFLASNLLDAVEGPFDVITANLPYIEQPTLAENPVAKWEPIVALDGGPDGLVLIREMLTQAPSRLAPGGALFLEIGYDQGERGAALCQAAFPDAEVEVRSDLAELDRVIIVRT